MSASIIQFNVKDALGIVRQVQAVDASGLGNGPYTPLHGLSDEFGIPITPANPLPTVPGVGVAAEASAVAQALSGLNLLSTQAAGVRLGFWFFQNQSTASLYLALDDGAGNTLSVFAMAGAAIAGGQGASIGAADTGPHLGRIRVYGPPASQHALRVQ